MPEGRAESENGSAAGALEDTSSPSSKGPRRLDAYLVAQGFFATRSLAQTALMAGEVEIQGQAHPKAGDRVVAAHPPVIHVRARAPFVSRGGLKLAEAFGRWPLAVENRACVDLGASTGGFTDCLLQHGAAHVYAVDVGQGQLHPRLATDDRVTVMDRTNARYLRAADIPRRVSFVTADLAFISLRLVLPTVWDLLTGADRSADPSKETGTARPADGDLAEEPDGLGDAVVLVKPQFEAGRADVGKHGVVRSPDTWRRVLCDVVAAAQGQGFTVRDVAPSPIRGPEGNVEFLLWLGMPPSSARPDTVRPKRPDAPGVQAFDLGRVAEAVREAETLPRA